VNVWQGEKNTMETFQLVDSKKVEHMNEWMKNVLDEKITMGTR
jgi:hypothetical protein